MKGTTYGYTRGNGDSRDVVVELERLRKERGELTAEMVVEAAADEGSPIHGQFTWDDDAAAHQFRLMQARGLIRRVTVSVRGAEPRRMYVHVERPGEAAGAYEPMESVVDRPDQFAVALAELTRRLSTAQQAVDELRRIAGMGKDPEQSARLIVVVEAFRAAEAAVRSLQ